MRFNRHCLLNSGEGLFMDNELIIQQEMISQIREIMINAGKMLLSKLITNSYLPIGILAVLLSSMNKPAIKGLNMGNRL